jgi:hypothetical protein
MRNCKKITRFTVLDFSLQLIIRTPAGQTVALQKLPGSGAERDGVRVDVHCREDDFLKGEEP